MSLISVRRGQRAREMGSRGLLVYAMGRGVIPSTCSPISMEAQRERGTTSTWGGRQDMAHQQQVHEAWRNMASDKYTRFSCRPRREKKKKKKVARLAALAWIQENEYGGKSGCRLAEKLTRSGSHAGPTQVATRETRGVEPAGTRLGIRRGVGTV